MNNGGNQYALLLYAIDDAIDDAVAVHKSLADRSVVNLWNNAAQFRAVGNGLGRFDDLCDNSPGVPQRIAFDLRRDGFDILNGLRRPR